MTTIDSCQAVVCTVFEEDIDENFHHWSCFRTSVILCMKLLNYVTILCYTCHSFLILIMKMFIFGSGMILQVSRKTYRLHLQDLLWKLNLIFITLVNSLKRVFSTVLYFMLYLSYAFFILNVAFSDCNIKLCFTAFWDRFCLLSGDNTSKSGPRDMLS